MGAARGRGPWGYFKSPPRASHSQHGAEEAGAAARGGAGRGGKRAASVPEAASCCHLRADRRSPRGPHSSPLSLRGFSVPRPPPLRHPGRAPSLLQPPPCPVAGRAGPGLAGPPGRDGAPRLRGAPAIPRRAVWLWAELHTHDGSAGCRSAAQSPEGPSAGWSEPR